MECKRLPTPKYLKELVTELAKKEIIQKPSFVKIYWYEEFGKFHMSEEELHKILQSYVPSVKGVLSLLRFPQSMDASCRLTERYLKTYIKWISSVKMIKSFLRFCTGFDIIKLPIAIEFNDVDGLYVYQQLVLVVPPLAFQLLIQML